MLSMLEGQTPQKIFTPNSEIIMQATRDPELRDILNSAELIVPDGAGVILASRIMKNELKEKVSGIDLVRQIFANTKKRPASFFILGGKPGVAEEASVNIVYDYPKQKLRVIETDISMKVKYQK